MNGGSGMELKGSRSDPPPAFTDWLLHVVQLRRLCVLEAGGQLCLSLKDLLTGPTLGERTTDRSGWRTSALTSHSARTAIPFTS